MRVSISYEKWAGWKNHLRPISLKGWTQWMVRFWAKPVEILELPSPSGYVLNSFGKNFNRFKMYFMVFYEMISGLARVLNSHQMFFKLNRRLIVNERLIHPICRSWLLTNTSYIGFIFLVSITAGVRLVRYLNDKKIIRWDKKHFFDLMQIVEIAWICT